MQGKTLIEKPTRRDFLNQIFSAGTLILGASMLPGESAVGRARFHPNVFLGLETDGTVYIVAHRSEMGNGAKTALPRIVADEMDADWKRVKIIQADANPVYGSQMTVASHSILEFFHPMRQLGATARLMLIEAAARGWSVSVEECDSALHTVIHKPTQKTKSFGELAAPAALLPLPEKDKLRLKSRSEWRYIGKDTSAYDLHNICNGSAVYGMDARIEGMLYAAIERPPVVGSKLKSCDVSEALEVPGVKTTVEIEPFTPPHHFQPLGGVAVVADNTWAAFQGRKKIKAAWTESANSTYDSDAFKKELQETVRHPCKVLRERGKVDAVFEAAGRIVEAEYYVPHLAHASMEPPVALASFERGKLTLWAPTQDPQGLQEAIAKQLRIAKEDVTCHVTLLGGGFGRKAFGDFAVEAAVLAKQLGRPVKVVWSREDDIKHDFYLPVAAMYLKAALSPEGKPLAWLQRSAYPPINSTFDANATYGSWEVKGNWIEVPFDVANFRVEIGPARARVRMGWLRSVGSAYHTFALQSFVSELAHATDSDPLEYLLELFGPDRQIELEQYQDSGYPLEISRLRRVTELAAEKAGWGKRVMGHGRGMGIAAQRYSSCYVASVVEVEIGDSRKPRLLRITTAVDAGTPVNPDGIRAQMEGSAVFGTSITFSGAITLKNGQVQQSNFHDYRIARMSDAPLKTEVHVVASDAPPSGAGEAGVSVVPPAICNAIFAAIGKRIRELPLMAV